MQTKMANGHPYSKCGTLEQLNVNFPSCSYKRSFRRLASRMWKYRHPHPPCGGGRISFKRNLVKVKKKVDPEISLLGIYPSYLICIHNNNAHYNIEITRLCKQSKSPSNGN